MSRLSPHINGVYQDECCLERGNDGADVTSGDSSFHMLPPEIGNARLPAVVRQKDVRYCQRQNDLTRRSLNGKQCNDNKLIRSSDDENKP